MSSCVLLAPEGTVEHLPPCVQPCDLLLRGPHYIERGCGWELHWSSTQHSEVNDLASRLAGQRVKGEALLKHSGSSGDLAELLRGPHLRRMPQPAAPRGVQPCAWDDAGASSSKSDSTKAAAMKRARSTRHIAAANRARQCILDSTRACSRGASSCTSCDAPGSSESSSQQQRLLQQGSASVPDNKHAATMHGPSFVAPCGSSSDGGATPAGASCSSSGTHLGAHPTPSDSSDGSDASSSAMSGAAPVVMPAWADVCVEVVGRAASFLGDTAASVAPVLGVCRSWRRAVLEDDQLLLRLAFRLRRQGATQPERNPALLERAVRVGNVSALVVAARLLDARGKSAEAMRYWRRAAKAGHVEGQLLLGLGLYRGSDGLPQDAEDAHLWLSRALKQVQGSNGSSGGVAAPGGSSDAAKAAPCAAGGCSSSGVGEALRGRVLRQAGLVLGYLHFDGEGCGRCADRQEAMRCFKLAAAAGAMEAEQVLGWMVNTGQY